MKRLILCGGIGTTALKRGVIPNILHFSPWEYIEGQPVILPPHMLQTCQDFQLQTSSHETLIKAADNDQAYLATLKALLKSNSKVDTNICIQKDLVRCKNRWYIPKDKGLKQTILEAGHV